MHRYVRRASIAVRLLGAKDPPPAATPIELGGYRLVELLGRGGMGEVWRAEREGPGGIRRRAAVKRILPSMQTNTTLLERFIAEARINARLESPNIVQVLDFGDKPEPYLVLEFVEGISAAELLRELAQNRKRLPVVAAAFIAAEVASGLDHAHRKRDDDGQPLNIVHRDVSPQNILISLDGAVKISDFGVARSADNQFRTQHGVQIGKIGYMPPEQMQGGAIDARSDVFSLGVALWELLTVQPMLPRDDARAALDVLFTRGIQTPSQVEPKVPASVDAVLMPALAIDPAQRYASAGAFAQALRSFVHSLAPGFDSNELIRILAKLMPHVRFHVPTTTLNPAQSTSAPGPGPGPSSAPAPSPPPKHGLGAAVPLARAPQMMPVMQAPPSAASPPRIAMTSSPALPPAPSADAVERMRAAMAVQSPGARSGESFPPLPRSSPWPLVIGAIFVLSVIAGVALAIGFKRSRARVHPTTEALPSPPPRVPLSMPTTPVAPPLVPAGAPVPVEPVPVPGLMAGGPSNTAPGVPAVMPSLPPSQVAPSAADVDAGAVLAPTPVPPPTPVVAPTPAVTPTPSPPSHPRAPRGGEAARAAQREVQTQLGSLRGMVRACLGVREGSGARVSLGVHYDPALALVDRIEIQTASAEIGPPERACIDQTVRGAVHVSDATAPQGTAWFVYEY